MPSSTLYAIAAAIKKARENANLKQETAAKLLNIARPTLSGYENDNIHLLPLHLLLDMSRVYKCTVASLIEPIKL